MKKLDDDKLMDLVAEGNQKALEVLFDRHSSMVLGYASRLLGQKEKGEDISQDVWVKLVKAAPSYKGSGHLKAWLKTMTRNACLNEIRKLSRWQTSEDVEVHVEALTEVQLRSSLENELLVKTKIEQLKVEIERLPDTQRFALVTWLNEEMSYEDLAQEMKLSVSAIKSVLFRARQTLQSALLEAS